MKRNVARDIWRAVIVAGAMLGTSACTTVPSAEGNEPAEVSPDDDGEGDELAQKKKPKKVVADAAPPPADAAVADAAPPDARPRTQKREPRGRGFVLG
jgi:hypothetical protein